MCQNVFAPYVVRVSSGSCAWTRKLDLFINAPLQCRPRPETITFETQFFPALKFEFRCWEEHILKYFLLQKNHFFGHSLGPDTTVP